MNKTFLEYQQGIDSLTVFRALRSEPVIRGLRDLFASLAKAPSFENHDIVDQYCDVLAALYPHGADLSAYIQRLVLTDDNFYVREAAAGRRPAPQIRDSALRELDVLQDLANLESHDIKAAIHYKEDLPVWTNSPVDLASDFRQKLDQVPVTGYGIFARYTFFRILDEGGTALLGPAAGAGNPGGPAFAAGSPGGPAFGTGSPGGPAFGAGSGGRPDAAVRLLRGQIVPVAHPDVQPLSQLFRYERERSLILRNTEALLDGTGASNMLLYGDAGTGKSSTIKAAVAEYADRGLRLIEVKKNQLYLIPEIADQLADNPLKFILFIDDLSFSGNDDNFSALKATLEGSVAGCTGNTVIYATSNRRHLVRETFSDREGDELHVNDSLQETMSLAARFGLTITFSKPDRDDYLEIVRSLAAEYGVDMPEDELLRRAEAHAIRRGGRSPRTAKQFVELVKIGL